MRDEEKTANAWLQHLEHRARWTPWSLDRHDWECLVNIGFITRDGAAVYCPDLRDQIVEYGGNVIDIADWRERLRP